VERGSSSTLSMYTRQCGIRLNDECTFFNSLLHCFSYCNCLILHLICRPLEFDDSFVSLFTTTMKKVLHSEKTLHLQEVYKNMHFLCSSYSQEAIPSFITSSHVPHIPSTKLGSSSVNNSLVTEPLVFIETVLSMIRFSTYLIVEYDDLGEELIVDSEKFPLLICYLCRKRESKTPTMILPTFKNYELVASLHRFANHYYADCKITHWVRYDNANVTKLTKSKMQQSSHPVLLFYCIPSLPLFPTPHSSSSSFQT